MDLNIIRNTYLKTWFVPDLLSTVPIDKVAEMFLGGGDIQAIEDPSLQLNATGDNRGLNSNADLSSLSSLGLIRILRLARLLKLMRLLKLSKKAS